MSNPSLKPERVEEKEGIGTHGETHSDEALNIFMALLRGQKVFLGIERAWREGRVIFCDAGRTLPKNLPCKPERILWVGVGGGEFDEHREGQTGRECAATLMADRLGLRSDAAMERMVQWTLANDQEGEGVAFDWADIMKSYFNAGLPNMLVLKRSLRVFGAVYNTLSGSARYSDITGMRSYWQLAADFVLSLTDNPYRDGKHRFTGPLQAAEAIGLAGDESISWILNYEVGIKGLDGKPPREPGFMEIPAIVDALYRDGATVGEVTHFVNEVHQARLAEQKLFLQAVDQWSAVTAANRLGQRHLDGRTFQIQESGVTYRVAVVFSDNRRIVSAIRGSSFKPHIIVRVTPKTMHIALFAKGLDVTPIVSRLRAACWAAVGNTSILPDDVLNREWTIDQVPQLCFQKKAGNILNGSMTAPHVPPVTIGLKKYMDCVVQGLGEIAKMAAQHRRDAKRRQQQRREARKMA